ncbi:MAG: ice-binding family protein, partial [Spirochaetales bacterium]
GTTATFNPNSDLLGSTVYTATITTGVQDLAGNALASNHSWTFTTAAIVPLGPSAVLLGSAGNYVILAKTAISATVGTAITGDLGISPAAQSFVTGFGLVEDATNEFATSSLVTGRVYSSNDAPPTPTILTTAVSDMETAYTDAAGRVTPDFTNLGAGNVTGLTLVPGLYTWGTSLQATSGFTISGGANDVWIFQVAGDLTIGNGVIVTLGGSAQAKNIFWQVAGQTSLGTTAEFKGVVLCMTQIVVQTGATVNGRLLAQTQVTLDANAVTEPAL